VAKKVTGEITKKYLWLNLLYLHYDQVGSLKAFLAGSRELRAKS